MSAGIKGGLAGSVAMAVLAVLYGVVKEGSVWYPINLLAAGGLGEARRHSRRRPARSSTPTGSLLACVIHLLTSLLVGTALRRDAADVPDAGRSCSAASSRPLLWTGLLHATSS